MKRIVDYIFYGLIFFLIMWFLVVLNEVFIVHLHAFLAVELFVPIAAIWGTSGSHVTEDLKTARFFQIIWTALSAIISLGCLIHFNLIRDEFGQKVIRGFEVFYYKGLDSSAQPMLTSDIYTSHWYSQFGLWVFEILFLAMAVLIPFVTCAVMQRPFKAIRS